MCDALRVMRRVHQQISLLEAAGALPLTEADQDRRNRLLEALSPELDWTVETLLAFEIDLMERDIQRFLKSLKSYFPGRANA